MELKRRQAGLGGISDKTIGLFRTDAKARFEREITNYDLDKVITSYSQLLNVPYEVVDKSFRSFVLAICENQVRNTIIDEDVDDTCNRLNEAITFANEFIKGYTKLGHKALGVKFEEVISILPIAVEKYFYDTKTLGEIVDSELKIERVEDVPVINKSSDSAMPTASMIDILEIIKPSTDEEDMINMFKSKIGQFIKRMDSMEENQVNEVFVNLVSSLSFFKGWVKDGINNLKPALSIIMDDNELSEKIASEAITKFTSIYDTFICAADAQLRGKFKVEGEIENSETIAQPAAANLSYETLANVQNLSVDDQAKLANFVNSLSSVKAQAQSEQMQHQPNQQEQIAEEVDNPIENETAVDKEQEKKEEVEDKETHEKKNTSSTKSKSKK